VISRPSQLVFVDRPTLQRVEREMRRVAREHRLTALGLIDRTGLLLAAVGDLPLPPDQMGATAAGVFSAVSAIVHPAEGFEFTVQLASGGIHLHFREVDPRLFLCAFYMDPATSLSCSSVLRDLSELASHLLADQTADKRKLCNLELITEKLDELFSKPN